VISEGSCDTEDWSTDAENTAFITGINYTLLYNQMYLTILQFLLFLIKLTQTWRAEEMVEYKKINFQRLSPIDLKSGCN